MLSSFQKACHDIRNSDIRFWKLDKSFYYSYCSLLCDNENAGTHLATFTDAMARNSSIEELALDGAILFRHANAAVHMQSIRTHLTESNPRLRALVLRWCGHEADLLEAVAAAASLQEVEMQVQRAVDVTHLLRTTQSIRKLSIQTSASVTGLTQLRGNNTLEALSILGRITDEEMHDLCEALQHNSTLTSLAVRITSPAQAEDIKTLLQSKFCGIRKLDVSFSDLRPLTSQVAIMEGLTCNRSIIDLNMSQVLLARDSDLNKDAWMQCFAKNKSLESLNVSGNYFKTSDIDTLVSAIMQSQTVKELNLERNALSAEACRLLFPAIPSLTKLHLNGIDLASDHDAEFFRDSLLQAKNLEELQIGHVWLSGETPRSYDYIIEGILGNASLQHLSVDCFGRTPEHVRDLLCGLCDKPLRTLKLSQSKFTPSTCNAALRDLIVRNHTIEEIDLGKHIAFTDETIQAVASGLRVNRSLRALRLYQCELSTNAWIPLLESLQVNQTLHVLDLQCISPQNHEGDELLKVVCQYLPIIQGLKEISFHGPGGLLLNDKQAILIIDALERNTSLQKISVTTTNIFHKNRIEYILDWNRAGRRVLRSGVSLSLWPVALTKATSAKDPTVLYQTLALGADQWNAHRVPLYNETALPSAADIAFYKHETTQKFVSARTPKACIRYAKTA